MKSIFFKAFIFLFLSISFFSCGLQSPKVLVFTKTAGFRHGSIESGVMALEKMAKEKHFLIDTTANSAMFTEANLKQYKAVVFLNTTGDILNDEEQKAFEKYIKSGGGYVGIHAAADAEYNWPWYNKLVGGYFNGHPKVQKATLQVIDSTHLSTKMLKGTWEKVDEWYNYKDLNRDVNVLLNLDEKSYNGGKNGDYHPMAWYHDYDGGRAFYTGLGHTNVTFKNPVFLEHLYGGLEYAMGEE
ncbi:ThuA domain-containing protein [Cellulophaga lytica]|uniref:ThuA domain-containing protein n=1 Tax=Cellulophaga lytica TaxID=979 RepID=UPI003CE498EB